MNPYKPRIGILAMIAMSALCLMAPDQAASIGDPPGPKAKDKDAAKTPADEKKPGKDKDASETDEQKEKRQKQERLDSAALARQSTGGQGAAGATRSPDEEDAPPPPKDKRKHLDATDVAKSTQPKAPEGPLSYPEQEQSQSETKS